MQAMHRQESIESTRLLLLVLLLLTPVLLVACCAWSHATCCMDPIVPCIISASSVLKIWHLRRRTPWRHQRFLQQLMQRPFKWCEWCLSRHC
jgi:hypothetical protein